MKRVSILLPAHNEAPRIAANIRRVCDTAQRLIASEWRGIVEAFEVIVADDGSTDNTWVEIERASAGVPAVKTIRLPINYGKGMALRMACQHATGSWVFFIDADLDIAPEHMADLARILIRDKVDAVLGSKQSHETKAHYPWYRRIVSLGYAFVVRCLLPLPVRDTQTGFKLFTRAVLDAVCPRMLVRRYAFDIELLSIAHHMGFTMKQCPVEVSFSDKRGSVTLRNIYHMSFDTLSVFYRLKILHYYDSWQSKDYGAQPRISVVIAVKNDNPYLRQSVTETLKQSYPNFEIIVLPDEPVSGYDPRVRIVPTGNELPAIKRNNGVREATGEIVAFLDDDAYPYGEWLKELAANFADPTIGAVGGPGLTPPEDSFWQKVSGAVYASFAASGSYRYRYIYDRRRETDDYPTCNLAVRKTVFEAANGFQSNYWPGEDTELCLTITRKLGSRIVYDPQVEVYHHRRSLWRGHFRQVTQYALHRGYFVKKFPETSRKLSYFMPTLFALGSVLGWTTIWWCLPLFWVYLAVMALYACVVLAGSFFSSPKLLVPAFIGTVLTHYAYGFYFIIGLLAPRLSRREERKG